MFDNKGEAWINFGVSTPMEYHAVNTKNVGWYFWQDKNANIKLYVSYLERKKDTLFIGKKSSKSLQHGCFRWHDSLGSFHFFWYYLNLM